MSEEVIAGEAPIGDKYGCAGIGIPVSEVADSAELILVHAWLKHAIQISFAEDVVQGNGVQGIEAAGRSGARRVESARVVRVSGDVELTAVASNEIVFAFVQDKREMRVELAQEEREGGGEQLFPLLVESRAGKGINSSAGIHPGQAARRFPPGP